LTKCQALRNHNDAGLIITIHEVIALQGSHESIGLELIIGLAFPNSLDKLCTESAVHLADADHLTDKIATVDTDEIQTRIVWATLISVSVFSVYVLIIDPALPKVKPF